MIVDTSEATEVMNCGLQLKFEVTGGGEKTMTINSTTLQNKQSAVRLLAVLMKRVGKLADEMIEPVIAVAQGLLNYKQSEGVRKYSAQVLGIVLRCCAQPTKAEALIRNLIPIFG